jgi:chemosensory pili system protein ChpA (sensor histidine kinase/response regulator)
VRHAHQAVSRQRPLAQALSAAIDGVARRPSRPAPKLAMEVATAVLYLEAAFQDLDPNDAQLAERTRAWPSA